MLGKLLGGVAAALGSTMAVFIMTRSTNTSSWNVILPLLVAGSGIAVFLLSNRRLAGYASIAAEETPPAVKKRMSAVSWLLLLLFAGIFVACVYFLIG